MLEVRVSSKSIEKSSSLDKDCVDVVLVVLDDVVVVVVVDVVVVVVVDVVIVVVVVVVLVDVVVVVVVVVVVELTTITFSESSTSVVVSKPWSASSLATKPSLGPNSSSVLRFDRLLPGLDCEGSLITPTEMIRELT